MKRLAALLLAVACGSPPPPGYPAQPPAQPPEEATPTGQITEAPRDPASPRDDEQRQHAATPLPGAGPRPAQPSSLDYRVLAPFDGAPIEHRFAAAYTHVRRPSIAVFFNRTLSDEVREWLEPMRTTTATSETKVIGPGGGMVVDRNIESSTNAPDARPVGEARADVAERMAWQVETAFSQPMLAQGVRLVDRATIMRLVALGSGKQDDPRAMIAVKQVEMAALVGHADYFVELLVSSSSDSPLGYDLKATVKEVKTGQIVANLSTATWTYNAKPMMPPAQRRSVATDHGYEYVDVPPPPVHAIYPTTSEVTTRMADMVLGQLADAFERTAP